MTNGPKLPTEALEFFRAKGAKGGRVRARKLTKEQRSESARKAVKARWAKAKEQTSS